MNEYEKQNHKGLVLVISLLFFLFALGYTLIYSMRTDLIIHLNNRNTVNAQPQSSQILGINANKTLREVLEENNFPIDDNYSYSADLDTKVRYLKELNINRKVSGNIQVDGETISYNSGANTIEDLLDEQGIKLSTIDFTEPDKKTALTGDLDSIIVHRQDQRREEREEAIAYETEVKYDNNIEDGKIVVDIPGLEGKQNVVEDIKYLDGKPIERNVVKQDVLLNPVTEIVRVGTRTEQDIQNAINSNTAPQTLSNSIDNLNYYGTSLNKSDFDLVCAIVEHEAGTDYTSALAVMSCVMNRVDSPNYPNDPVGVLTAPGQFESYLGGYYQQFLGKSSTDVREAVKEVLAGKRIHNYLNFRSYQTEGSEKIGGNWYFND